MASLLSLITQVHGTKIVRGKQKALRSLSLERVACVSQTLTMNPESEGLVRTSIYRLCLHRLGARCSQLLKTPSCTSWGPELKRFCVQGTQRGELAWAKILRGLHTIITRVLTRKAHYYIWPLCPWPNTLELASSWCPGS